MIFPSEVTIEVTEDDIKNGKRASCNKCPIALAFKRAIPAAEQVTVTGVYIAVTDGKVIREYADYSVPNVAADFMEAYDARETVEPFTFTSYKRGR